MPKVDFSNFTYYPDLCCSDGEHMGFRELGAEDKESLLPIFELGQNRHEPDLTQPIEMVRASAEGRPFILDLSKAPAPPAYEPKAGPTAKTVSEREATRSYNEMLASLLDRSEGFANWRRLVASFPNCVPVLQYTDAMTERDAIIRCAGILSQDGGSLAVRITKPTCDAVLPVIGTLIAELGSPERFLVIIDCGQGRRIADRPEFAADALLRLHNAVPLPQQPYVRAVCMSSSYPDTQQLANGLKEYEGCEWEIWRTARGVGPIAFGDYAATHRKKKSSTFVAPGWKATVAYPLDEGWLVFRDANATDSAGWSTGSKQITAHPKYPPPPECWGQQVLERAASGDLTDVESARFWYAAKVNMHIHRRLKVSRDYLGEAEEDDG